MGAIPQDAQIVFDRRGEQRVDQMQRTIIVEAEGRKYPFVLRNISSMGASGHCDAPLAIGHVVSMIFEGWRRAAGKVRWNRQGLIGIEFVGRLSLDLLSPASHCRVNREPRYRVARPVTIAVGNVESAATIRNISVTGALIETRLHLAPAQQFRLLWASGEELAGHVRWVSPGRAGLQFAAPISLDGFEHD